MSNPSHTALSIPKTQIADIDKQYQKINSVTQLLVENMDKDCSGINIPQVFFNLTHIHTHYFTQQQITLVKYNFGDLSMIKAIHKKFLDRVIVLNKHIEHEPKLFCEQMVNFLMSWSTEYFEINQIAVDFLKSKGVE